MALSYAGEPVYRCVGPQGETFSNKQLKGQVCTPITLPQLGSVPNRLSTSVIETPTPMAMKEDDHRELMDYPLIQDAHGSLTMNPALGHGVGTQVCDLYGKWLDLNLATRGGLYYNPITAPLITLFGGGFIPMECRK